MLFDSDNKNFSRNNDQSKIKFRGPTWHLSVSVTKFKDSLTGPTSYTPKTCTETACYALDAMYMIWLKIERDIWMRGFVWLGCLGLWEYVYSKTGLRLSKPVFYWSVNNFSNIQATATSFFPILRPNCQKLALPQGKWKKTWGKYCVSIVPAKTSWFNERLTNDLSSSLNSEKHHQKESYVVTQSQRRVFHLYVRGKSFIHASVLTSGVKPHLFRRVWGLTSTLSRSSMPTCSPWLSNP